MRASAKILRPRSHGLNFWPPESVGEDFFIDGLVAPPSHLSSQESLGLVRASGKILRPRSHGLNLWPPPGTAQTQLSPAQPSPAQLSSAHLTSPHLSSLRISSAHLTADQLSSLRLRSNRLTSPHIRSPQLTLPQPKTVLGHFARIFFYKNIDIFGPGGQKYVILGPGGPWALRFRNFSYCGTDGYNV